MSSSLFVFVCLVGLLCMSLYVFLGLCLCMGQCCLKSPGEEGGGSVPFYIMHAIEKTSNQNAQKPLYT